jgi:broad-specificity NMP kinase
MIIIINGSLGVGKTSVAEHLTTKFNRAVHLDGDAIGDVHPFAIYDDARITHLYHTLAHLIAFHQENGYPNFVINYVFESHTSLQELLNLLRPLDNDVQVYWLTCRAEEQEKRIRARSRDQISWELERFVELQAIQAQAAEGGFIGEEVDTTGLSVDQVVEKIWGMVHE